MESHEAIQLARSYLIANVGNLVGPGEAYYDKRANLWCVEILCGDPFQPLKIGEARIDASTRQVMAPSTGELLRNWEKQKDARFTLVLEIPHPNERTYELLTELAAGRGIQTV
jgi:hypothetical protein